MTQLTNLLDCITNNSTCIQSWMDSKIPYDDVPFYTSVDIRDAGYKMAVVDTNIFPAGFNNLSLGGLETAIFELRRAVNARVHPCKNILIVMEEHTRNKWYLENVKVLKEIVEAAGFSATVTAFLGDEYVECSESGQLELETATGAVLEVLCIKFALDSLSKGALNADMIILNNDLSRGIPDEMFELNIPIYPSVHAGWHSRKKSHHFALANDYLTALCTEVNCRDIDPWLLSTLFDSVQSIDINDAADRERLMDTANDLFNRIKSKFKEHNVTEKPFMFLKANTGTYGMGVMAIEDPSDIRDLNRKGRNKMNKGKSSVVNTSFILQEGVPSLQSYDRGTSEIVMYQISNTPVGGFLRVHSEKGARDNLNSKGMRFVPFNMANTKEYPSLPIYRLMAQAAGLAAAKEIMQLEPTPEVL